MKTISEIYIGGNVCSHDSAAFIVAPEIKEVIGISTERVTRVKHDKMFFFPAVKKAIENRQIDPKSVKKIFLGHTFTTRKDERYHRNEYALQMAEREHFKTVYTKGLEDARKHFDSLSPVKKISNLIKDRSGRILLYSKIFDALRISKKDSVDAVIRKEFRKIFPNAEIVIEYFDHQANHTTSSYFTSPFESALLFSYDAWGDNLFSRIIHAKNGEFTEIAKSPCHYVTVSKTEYPNIILGSPAGIYAYVTHLLGFKPTSEEGKVEALAAFAQPNKELYDMFMSLFSIDSSSHSLVCDVKKAEDLLEMSKMREFVEKFKREEIAASVQTFLDDITRNYLEHIFTLTDERNLCLSGGASANVIMNLMVFEKLTPNIHITPAMADDGTAQGAALQMLMKNGYAYEDLRWLKGEAMPYYGTSYTKPDIHKAIKFFGTRIVAKDLGNSWPEETAKLLAQGKIGAIFHGRMEWGPRALGNRSIVADPRPADFREKINKEIKRRPSFQPFCPSILAEEASRLFEAHYMNKHMTCAFRMKKEFWSKLPSAIHIDGTARAQFVTEKDNPNYYRLLKKVKELTGFGVIINTSFNKHGRTIVETPEDAILDFLDTDMDYVILEGILITRK